MQTQLRVSPPPPSPGKASRLTHLWYRLDNVTEVDEACVREDSGSGEARQGLALGT